MAFLPLCDLKDVRDQDFDFTNVTRILYQKKHAEFGKRYDDDIERVYLTDSEFNQSLRNLNPAKTISDAISSSVIVVYKQQINRVIILDNIKWCGNAGSIIRNVVQTQVAQYIIIIGNIDMETVRYRSVSMDNSIVYLVGHTQRVAKFHNTKRHVLYLYAFICLLLSDG